MDIKYLVVGLFQFLFPETHGWLNGWGWIRIKVLEPNDIALGSTPEVSRNERFSVADVSYDVKRAEPRAV
jgi:hypothetical protein